MKNSSDTNGNRTRYLPASSAERVPSDHKVRIQIINVWKCSYKKCRGVSQYMLVVVYRRFGTSYQSHLQEPRACLTLEKISTHTLHASIHTHTHTHTHMHTQISTHIFYSIKLEIKMSSHTRESIVQCLHTTFCDESQQSGLGFFF